MNQVKIKWDIQSGAQKSQIKNSIDLTQSPLQGNMDRAYILLQWFRNFTVSAGIDTSEFLTALQDVAEDILDEISLDDTFSLNEAVESVLGSGKTEVKSQLDFPTFVETFKTDSAFQRRMYTLFQDYMRED